MSLGSVRGLLPHVYEYALAHAPRKFRFVFFQNDQQVDSSSVIHSTAKSVEARVRGPVTRGRVRSRVDSFGLLLVLFRGDVLLCYYEWTAVGFEL